MPAAQRLTVWLGASPGAAELFLCACARAGVPGAADPAPAGAGIRFLVRAGEPEPADAAPGCDVLVALDEDTAAWSGAARRLVLYDAAAISEPAKLKPGAACVALASADAASIAATLAFLAGLDLGTVTAAWTRRLRHESTEAAALKIQSARRAFASAEAQLGAPPCPLRRGEKPIPLLSGGQALGLGAVAAGCTCLMAPDSGRAGGPAGWLLGLAARGGLAALRCSDEAAALAAAAGAVMAGARALADLSSGSLAWAGPMLECCARSGLPVVVVAGEDGWRWPAGLPVGELRPRGAAEACALAAEAFNLAERTGAPVVLRAGPELLGRWEAVPDLDLGRPLARGRWACGPQAPAEARAVPGQEGAIRAFRPLPADELTRRRAALDGEAAPAPEGTSPLFPVPQAASLEERETLPPESFLPGEALPAACASAEALRLLARAWSEHGLQPKDILVVAGGSCCLPEPLLPRTYGALVPPGLAAAAAAGAKLADPALSVACCDDAASVLARGLPQLLSLARENHDILALLWEGPGAADLLAAAGLAEAGLLARLPAEGALSRALAHKGFSLVAVPCAGGLEPAGSAPAAGVLRGESGRPAFHETLPLLEGGSPVALALDQRPRLCAALAEELA